MNKRSDSNGLRQIRRQKLKAKNPGVMPRRKDTFGSKVQRYLKVSGGGESIYVPDFMEKECHNANVEDTRDY